MTIFLICLAIYCGIHLYLLSKKVENNSKAIKSMYHNKEECKNHCTYIKGIKHGKKEAK